MHTLALTVTLLILICRCRTLFAINMTDMCHCVLHAIHYLLLMRSLFTDTNNIAYKNDEIKEIVGVDNQINSDANADSQNAIDTTSSSVHEGEVNPI
jgi:hypothetical protein